MSEPNRMKNKADYSLYKCPYEHLEKEVGHELKGPEGYENTYGVWCACGFRGPVFYLDPAELNLTLKWQPTHDPNTCPKCGGEPDNGFDRCMPPNPYHCSKCEPEFKEEPKK